MTSTFQRHVAVACWVAAIAAAWSMLTAPGYVSAAPTACAPGERSVFRCEAGRRQILVCTSSDLTSTGGFVQYRFGAPDRLEIALPAAGSDWRARTRGGTMMFSGGGGACLRFTQQDHRYTVYTAIGRGWGEKSGVIVERAGRRIGQVACTTVPESLIGPDFFEQAGIDATDRCDDVP